MVFLLVIKYYNQVLLLRLLKIMHTLPFPFIIYLSIFGLEKYQQGVFLGCYASHNVLNRQQKNMHV